MPSTTEMFAMSVSRSLSLVHGRSSGRVDGRRSEGQCMGRYWGSHGRSTQEDPAGHATCALTSRSSHSGEYSDTVHRSTNSSTLQAINGSGGLPYQRAGTGRRRACGGTSCRRGWRFALGRSTVRHGGPELNRHPNARRFEFETAVVLMPYGEDGSFLATSVNLSETGMLLKADRRVEKGQRLEFMAGKFAGGVPGDVVPRDRG